MNKMLKAEKKEEGAKKKLQEASTEEDSSKERGQRSHTPPQQCPHRPQLQSEIHQRTTKTRSFSGPPRFPKGNTFKKLKL